MVTLQQTQAFMNSKHTLNSNEQEKNIRIIDGFKNNNTRIIGECYAEMYPLIVRYITNNSGDETTAKEIIWECFEVFFKNCTKPDFVLNAKFSSYIHSIANNIWLKRLRDNKKYNYTDIMITESSRHDFDDDTDNPYASDIDDYTDQITETIYENDLSHVIRQLLLDLTEECKTIFRLKHEEEQSHEEIASLLQISIDMSKSRLYRCSIKMAQAIKNSPYYRELIDGFPFLTNYTNKKRKS